MKEFESKHKELNSDPQHLHHKPNAEWYMDVILALGDKGREIITSRSSLARDAKDSIEGKGERTLAIIHPRTQGNK